MLEIWQLSLNGSDGETIPWQNILSPDEQERVESIRIPRIRRRFIRARTQLRSILSRYMNEAPERLRFQYGPRGKPELLWPKKSGVHFNLSHSEDHALLAVSDEQPVGVDVEVIRPIKRLDRIAARLFMPEYVTHLKKLDGQKQLKTFFRYWVRHEARLKACGSGFAARSPNEQDHAVSELDLGPDLVAAVAVTQ